jgi:uncharacterized protein with PIN domain
MLPTADLEPHGLEASTFVADVHLGKLARRLRLLGFDTQYSNRFTAAHLRTITLTENRILLSRSKAFSGQPGIRSFVVESENTDVQLKDVLRQFGLHHQLRPFSRCLACNGLLQPVPKEAVYPQLEPNTAIYYQAFWRCSHCRQVYWKGAHYNRMLAWIATAMQHP